MKSSLAVRIGIGLLLSFGTMVWDAPAGQATGRGGGGGFGGGFTGGGARIGTTGARSTSPYASGSMLGSADITYDPETRNLIVVSDAETYQQVMTVLKSMNRPAPQVLIKCAFVEVSHNKNLDIGVEGGVIGALNRSAANPITGSASNIFNLGGAGTSGAGLYRILGEDFQATLRAIAQAGKSQLISRPSILARNNQTAYISIGQQVPVVTGSTVSELTGAITSQFQNQNVGISLQVTPYITSSGLVEMYVTPQVSVLADRSQWVATSVSAGGTIFSPVINNRAADTVVIVPDGQTVVIGGLMENLGNTADRKIPILGDIPLLGNLFKQHAKDNARRELLIFITPYIVRHPNDLVGVTDGEKQKSPMTRQSFSNEELDQFLQTIPEKKSGTFGN